MIHARYEDAFRALTSEELDCCVEALSVAHPDMLELSDFEEGDQLMAYCRQEHISQSELIMAMRNDTRVAAISAVERLLMKPIDRRSPRQVELERHAANPPPAIAASIAPNERLTDARIITVLTTSNPKRAGTSAHDRFAKYRTGMTVAAFLRAGGTTGDINWDQQRSFIRIDEPA